MSYQHTSAVDSLGLSNVSELKDDAAKPSLIIIGGHQGNSMLAHTFIAALVAKLVHGFHKGEVEIVNLLKLRHIWFVPFLNIDTYKYIQSYSGDLSVVQDLVRSRRPISGCSNLDIGVSLLNNYEYRWGSDNFGSSGTS